MVLPIPATEVASITMKEGVDIFDKSSNAYELWQQTISTVAKTEGYRALRYGCILENPSIVEFVIDWDSVESHEKFQASPEYGPFSERLGRLMTGIRLHHFHPKPFPPMVLDSAPVTEMATFFGADSSFNDNVGKFVAAIKGAEGSLGFAHGEIVEELAKDEDGKPGKAVQLCIGWESKDVHMKFRDTDMFKENIHFLRKGVSGVEMHHTSFTSL